MTAIGHCLDCQKHTGGTSWPLAVVMKNKIDIEGDTGKYSRDAPSGGTVTMHFCSNCGATIFGEPSAWSDIITISASTLDNLGKYSPMCHVLASEAPKWACFIEGLPVFAQNASPDDVAKIING